MWLGSQVTRAGKAIMAAVTSTPAAAANTVAGRNTSPTGKRVALAAG